MADIEVLKLKKMAVNSSFVKHFDVSNYVLYHA